MPVTSQRPTTSTPLLGLSLPASDAAPGLARSAVRSIEGVTPGVSDVLVLLVSDVVATAVRRSSVADVERIEVRVDGDGEAIAVQVTHDEPATAGSRLDPREDRWTTFLLDQLAAGWGVHRRRGKTSIWFRLPVAGEDPDTEVRRHAGGPRARPIDGS